MHVLGTVMAFSHSRSLSISLPPGSPNPCLGEVGGLRGPRRAAGIQKRSVVGVVAS